MPTKNPKPCNYWKRKAHVEKAVREIMQEHELTIVPTSSQLREWCRDDVDNAISTHYGGYQKLRIAFGETIPVIYGEGTDLENLKKRALDYMQEKRYKTLPPRKIMIADGQSALEASIGKLPGGVGRFRKTIGVEAVRVERGSWQNLDFRVAKAIEVMKKEGLKELPSSRVLNKLGYKSLVHAIDAYDKSFPEFREEVEEFQRAEILEEEIEKLKNLDYALERAYKFMEEHLEYEDFPEPAELVWHQRYDLLEATRMNGRTFEQFREMLRYYMDKRDELD